jgi:hypothetical protein
MSYYHEKKVAEAKRWSQASEAERAAEIKRRSDALEGSRQFIRDYRASARGGTRFNWQPRYPWTRTSPPGETNAEKAPEIIDGEFTVVEDADAPRDGDRESGQAAGGSGAAQAGSRAAPWQAAEDTPF